MIKTRQNIVNLLKTSPLSPSEIAEKIQISRQALHRHLKLLLKNRTIEKRGRAPHVMYELMDTEPESRIRESFLFFTDNLPSRTVREKTTDKLYKEFCSKLPDNPSKQPDFAFMLDSAAVYSSNIEGNTLNLNSFLNSRLQAKKLRPKEAQEIEDLVIAYDFSQNHPLNEKNMLKTHALLSKNFIRKNRQGIYREEPVGVFSERGMVYLATPAPLVGTEMDKLFKIIDDLFKKSLTPTETLFWASWLHLMLALIHPFSDGNGRIARLCEKWFLIQKLGPHMVFLPSEKYYFRERPAYYEALKLGVNYWEVDFKKSGTFLDLLPKALTDFKTH